MTVTLSHLMIATGAAGIADAKQCSQALHLHLLVTEISVPIIVMSRSTCTIMLQGNGKFLGPE